MNSHRLYLLDGHSLLYKAFHAVQGLTNAAGEPTNAIFGFLNTFQRLLRDHSIEHVAVVFDPPGPSFRAEMLPQYKANRPAPPPELLSQLVALKNLLGMMRIPVYEMLPWEADDLLATMARWAVDHGGEAWVVSVDKDLLQCVGPGVRVVREHMGKIEVMDEDAVVARLGVRPDQVPVYLGLLGDSSDNIPGVPGVGKKRAADLLNEFGTLDRILEEAQTRTKPKIWESLRENAEQARLSTQVATVRSNIEIPDLSWEILRWNLQPTPELFAELTRLGFTSIIRDLDLKPDEKAAPATIYRTLQTETELDGWIASIPPSAWMAIDTETTGLDAYTDGLVGISLSWRANEAAYIPVRQPGSGEGLQLDALRPRFANLFARADLRWVAHNWRFDWKMLAMAGLQPPEIADDTLLASYLFNPDRGNNGLKALGPELLGIPMTEISELIGSGDDLVSMATIDLEQVATYACRDADVTRQLADVLIPRLDEAGVTAVYRDIELPLVPVLSRMELEGVRIDRPYFQELSREAAGRLDILRAEALELAGKPFNLNSPKQVAAILFDDLGLSHGRKTSTGGYSTDMAVLEQLAKVHDLPAKILEYRQLEKLRGTYIDALPTMLNPRTGRLHTSFNQTIAATGRLSSSDPNLQNIPVRTEEGRRIRRGFIPREDGWVLLAADYSQIELRILAHLSGDEGLARAFRENIDIHTLTASRVYHVAPDKVTREMRSAAKAINFGIVYGMSAFRLGNDTNVSTAQAQQFIDDYFAAYSGVRAFMDATLESCRRDGFVRTMTGRRRTVADINAQNGNIRSQAERVAINTPIQGTSADMIKLAMIRIDGRLRREGLRARMILQVHDELIFDTPAGECEALEALVREEMTAALPLSVPVVVDVKTGPNWAEL